MRQLHFLKRLSVMMFALLLYQNSLGQSGSLKGIITDESKMYLPGANVLLDGSKKGTVSNFNGEFTLVKVPVGEQTITINFIGYQSVTKKINVTANQTTLVKIKMFPKTNLLDEVTIATRIGGETKALNKQRTNSNITNVISTDQIGKFPDANIGDAVKRIPGITMQVDQGEARNIIVRGLSPQLNSVTLNGSRIPSAEGDNRNIQMDLIPSDMIQTIQVNKAVTPDMDADALGGSVNLITRNAPQSFRLSATAGSGINTINNKRILNGSFLIGNRSKNEKFGWMIASSINDSDFGSDNIEAEWDNEFEFNNGNDTETINVNPYAKEFQQRNYLVQRIRRSFSANLDYKIDDNNSFFVKSMYNWRDDRENRFRTKYEILDGEDITQDDFLLQNNTPIQFPAEITKESKGGINNNRNKNRRLEDQRMQNYAIGGEHLIGSWKADWTASYAKASEERLNERYISFESSYIVNNDISDNKFPLFTAKNPEDKNDLDNFSYKEVTEENKYTQEEDFNIFSNFSIPAALFNSNDGFIKFGFKTRLKQKSRDNIFYEYDLEELYPTMANTSTRDLSSDNFLAGPKYKAGYFTSEAWLGNLDLNKNIDRELIYDEFLGANYKTKENVYAGYLMTEQQLTDKLLILAGVRLENTHIKSTGNIVNFDEDGEYTGHESTTFTNNYINILPSIHIKYNFTPNSILRFAYTNTIARPNYVDLVPYRNILREDEEIEIGNPLLNPAKSLNFDLMAEHYFSNIGILSAGVFYKNIQDFTYSYVTEIENNNLGANTNGFEVIRPQNGEDAYVLGLELSVQQKLSFLPGFAKNLNIYANYTYLTSEATGINNEDGDSRTNMTLPNTAPNMFNASIGYDDRKFSARISTNFSDAYIDEIGKTEFTDRYYDQQLFLDVNLGYTITKNLRLYADFTNLTNQPLRYYQGNQSRTMQSEYYGSRFTIGLKYDIFKK